MFELWLLNIWLELLKAYWTWSGKNKEKGRKYYEFRDLCSEVSPTVKFELNIYLSIKYLKSSALDPLDPQFFGILDPYPDPQNYAVPQIRIHWLKYLQKTPKKIFALETQVLLRKKKQIIKNVCTLFIFQGSSSFCIKISKKNEEKLFLSAFSDLRFSKS